MKRTDGLNIDRVAFIGRSYGEYMRMFDLDESSLKESEILDCPGGASSFTAEATTLGIKARACDILYDLSLERLLEKGEEDLRHVFDKFDQVSHLYSWEYYKDKNEVISLRKKALELFLKDFSVSVKDRYIYGKLPSLPFPDRQFPLVLSSHFLFLYGDRLSVDFHMASLKELMRVCSGEVRIFPLAGLDAKPYPYLQEIISFLSAERIEAEIVKVPFEFQCNSGYMMKLKLQTTDANNVLK